MYNRHNMIYSYFMKYSKIVFFCLSFVVSAIIKFNIQWVLSTHMTQPDIVNEVPHAVDDHTIKTQENSN